MGINQLRISEEDKVMGRSSFGLYGISSATQSLDTQPTQRSQFSQAQALILHVKAHLSPQSMNSAQTKIKTLGSAKAHLQFQRAVRRGDGATGGAE